MSESVVTGATRWLMGIFICLLLGAFVYANAAKPRVLILQSYDLSYSWSRDMEVAIDRVFKDKPYVFKKHYMDTKRHPDRAFAEKQGIVARNIIDEWVPDVLIALDDDAQKYVARHYKNHPTIKIIHAGINGDSTQYGYDQATNVTGILERKQLGAVRDVVIEGAKDGKGGWKRSWRIAHIGDTSGSVHEDARHIAAYDWKPVQLVGNTLVNTFEQWQAAVLDANRKADYLLTTNYRKIARSATDARLVSPVEVVAWTEQHATIPIIGTNGFYVEDGGMFALATSPLEQGETVAAMAVRVLDKGMEPSRIKELHSREFITYMRRAAMVAKGFEVPRVYESFARATNNYFE